MRPFGRLPPTAGRCGGTSNDLPYDRRRSISCIATLCAEARGMRAGPHHEPSLGYGDPQAPLSLKGEGTGVRQAQDRAESVPIGEWLRTRSLDELDGDAPSGSLLRRALRQAQGCGGRSNDLPYDRLRSISWTATLEGCWIGTPGSDRLSGSPARWVVRRFRCRFRQASASTATFRTVFQLRPVPRVRSLSSMSLLFRRERAMPAG